MTLEEAVATWNAATTERDRARVERVLWEEHGSGTVSVRRHGRAKWIVSLVTTVAKDVESRATILYFAFADEAWKLIDEEMMPPRTCEKLIAKARATMGDDSLYAAWRRVVADWRALPAYRSENGRVWRRDHSPRRAKQQSAAPRPSATPVREAIERVIDVELAHMPANERAIVARGILLDITPILDAAFLRVKRMRETNGSAMVLVASRTKLREACGLLSIDPPPPGGVADEQRAKRAMRKLAAAYHPDAHGGSEEYREKYDAVLNAYRMITEYNESLGRSDGNREAD